MHGLKIILFANSDWYLYNFRRSLAMSLREAGHEVVLVSPLGHYGERLSALGFRWIPAPMERGSLNPLRELALVKWLRDLIRQESPSLIHGFTIKCVIYGSLAAQWATRSASLPARVNSVAGLGYVFTSNDLKARLLRPVVKVLMRLALGGAGARLILQNPDDEAFFKHARLVDPARVHVIPGSGVDCRRFVPGSVTDAQESRNWHMRVLLPARLLWDKGVGEFIEAARHLRVTGRAIEFLLAGEPDLGNPSTVPEADILSWVEEGLVSWLGQVEDMPALFRSVHVVALPSYREGLPKSLIEAGASGCALVTTDMPGCREVVTDGVDGLSIPVRDSVALSDAIAQLHDDPDLRVRIGEAARRKALECFDERIIISRTLEVYRELLGTLPISRGNEQVACRTDRPMQ